MSHQDVGEDILQEDSTLVESLANHRSLEEDIQRDIVSVMLVVLLAQGEDVRDDTVHQVYDEAQQSEISSRD